MLDTCKIFGERLQAAREKKGLSRSALSAQCDMSSTSLTRYERGAGTPNLGIATALAAALDCSLDELFGLSEPQEQVITLTKEEYEAIKALLRMLAHKLGCEIENKNSPPVGYL